MKHEPPKITLETDRPTPRTQQADIFELMDILGTSDSVDLAWLQDQRRDRAGAQ